MPRRLLPLLLLTAAFALAACGSKATPTPFGDPVAGRDAFLTTCIACHGPEGKGVTGLGKDLTTSEFLRTQADDQMLAFLLAGRPASDPLNTTGVDMPPRGGNPAFTDDDLKNIIAFLRTIQQ
jgi:disulfide bond formation protein DsbB